MLYLDTSALLKLHVLESGSQEVQKRIHSQDYPLPIWEIQEAELINALHMKVFWKEIKMSQAETQIGIFKENLRKGFYLTPEIDRISLMETFRRLSAQTPKFGCRTLDVMHVACALELEATEFMGFDQRQLRLAGWAGLRVWPKPSRA